MKKQLLRIVLVIAAIMLVQPAYAILIDQPGDYFGPFGNFTLAGARSQSHTQYFQVLRLDDEGGRESNTSEGIPISTIKDYLTAVGLTTDDDLTRLVFTFDLNQTSNPPPPVIIEELVFTFPHETFRLSEHVNETVMLDAGSQNGHSRIELQVMLDLETSIWALNSNDTFTLAARIADCNDGPDYWYFNASFTLNPPQPPGGGGGTNPVPEPATMILLGSGLVGLASFGRKTLKK